MLKCAEVHLRSYPDTRGILTVVESDEDIPFEIKRVFTLTGCHGNRGGHCNPGSYVLWPVVGTVYVEVEDLLGNQLYHGVLGSGGGAGLYTPPDTAVHLSRWTAGAVLLVLSDWHYSEAKGRDDG